MAKKTVAQLANQKSPARKPRSSRRQWCFRLFAVALALAPFPAAELMFRAFGVGHDTRFVVQARDATSSTVWHFNPAADLAYYGIEGVSGPEARPFNLPKPEEVYRIIVVGGSTVAGFPYPFELAMPRQLEVVLSQQLPEMEFEVLNAGITSINSSSEVDIVRQLVADAQPDLIILHSGHNEFYGPGGSASTTSRFGTKFHRFMQGVRRQRTYQVTMSTIPRAKETHLVETLPTDINIPLDGPIFEQTVRHFESNLTKIIDNADSANIPLLISTVPSNLRDLAPLEPAVDEDLIAHISEAERHMSYLEFEDALKILEAAESDYSRDALLHYRRAQCLEQLNRNDEAANAFSLASDLDGCRFRAPGALLEVVRKLAQSRKSVMFCDVAEELRRRSEFPVPGNDFFLEHVHYNFAGTWEAASILGRAVVEQSLNAQWDDDRAPEPQYRDELLGVTQLDHLAADSLTLIIFQAWPLSLSAARIAETNFLTERITTTCAEIDPIELELFSTLGMTAMEQHLWLAMGERWLAAGQPQNALDSFQRHILRRPWEAKAYLEAASALDAMGNSSEAQLMRTRGSRCFQGYSAN